MQPDQGTDIGLCMGSILWLYYVLMKDLAISPPKGSGSSRLQTEGSELPSEELGFSNILTAQVSPFLHKGPQNYEQKALRAQMRRFWTLRGGS